MLLSREQPEERRPYQGHQEGTDGHDDGREHHPLGLSSEHGRSSPTVLVLPNPRQTNPIAPIPPVPAVPSHFRQRVGSDRALEDVPPLAWCSRHLS